MKVIKKSFGIIMTLSVLCLVLLIAGVFFLTKDNEKTFTNSGYIISYKSGNTEVNNFEEGVEYKYNVNGELVFKNNEKEKVVAGLDNFIHYTNGDTSFLQNGVILNLENVGDTTVPYYNITDKSLIEFDEDKYTIKNVSGDLTLNNWIGRISEKKYIVSAKNVTAKLAGSTDMILSSAVGNFFEITYEENGVVIVSDGVNTRSTTAENSYIYIGEDIVISLNDKYIYYNNEPKLSLSQMTINGDENIEIIPPEEEKEEDKNEEENKDNNQGTLEENNGGNGTNNGTTGNGATGDGTGEGGQGDATDGNGDQSTDDNGTDTDGNGNNNGSGGTGSSGDDEDEETEDGEIPVTTLTKNPIFRIVNADIGANTIDLDIEIIDEYKVIQSSLDVSVINMKTAEEVYKTQITDIKNVINIATPAATLSPETNYIVSISGNYTNEDISYEKQYFQRVFKTESLDIKLEKSFATKDTVSVLAKIGNASSVKGYNIAIYSKDNDKEPIETRPITIEGNSSEEEITFESLEPNKEYKVVLNNIQYNGVIYTDVEEDGTSPRPSGDYTLTLDVKTLKRPPFIGEVSAKVNDDMTKVKFDIGEVKDEDKSVVQYIYHVYEYSIADNEIGTEPVIEPIVKKDATPFEIDIDGTALKTGQSYRYMVIAEYDDNEKVVEIRSGLSNPFVAGAVPSVSFAIDKDKTTFNSVSGTIKIADDNCTVPIDGRSCYNQTTDPTTNEPLKIFVRYHDASSTTYSYEHIEANFNPQTMEYQLNLSQLKASTKDNPTNYVIEVFGSIDFKDGNGLQSCTASKYEAGECIQIGESMFATTNEIVPITVEWGEEKISNEDQVFSLGGNKLKSTGESSVEAQSLSTLTIKVYASDTTNIEDGQEIATIKRTGDIKNEFFDNNFTISATNTFGLDIRTLKYKTNGLLTKYYIFEIVEAKDIGEVNTIEVQNAIYPFEIDKDLRADDILEKATITAELKQVSNVDTGFDIAVGFDGPNLNSLYPDADYYLTLGVCAKTTDKCIDFKNFKINNEVKNNAKEYIFYYSEAGNSELKLKPGTDYYNEEELYDDKGVVKLYRGNEYSFRFYITVDENKDEQPDYYYPGRIGREYVETGDIKTTKKMPEFYLNPVSSTANSITYNFNVSDPDVSLYKDEDKEQYSIYYSVGQEEVEVPLELNKNIEFTIDGLSNNTPYSIYYNTAQTKTKNVENDVQVGHKVNYTFDGYYNLDDYNLDYVLENNEASNKITIKFPNEMNQILKRISVIEITLKQGTNSKVNLITKLNDCKDSTDCFKYFDYHYSNVKDWDRNKPISVTLSAYYDSGLIGAIGEKSEYGYLFQQNSTELGQGKYFEMLPNKASNTTDYTRYYFSETDAPKSIYDYHKVEKGEFDKDKYTGEFKMQDKILGSNFDNTKWFIIKSFPKSSEGYKYGTYTFNFKKVDKKEIRISEGVDNTFSYSVITPDISTSHNSIINGADISINTSSIIASEMAKNFVADKEDGKYYFYVELYNEDGTTLIETKKVEIKPQATTDFTFENLADNTKYIYKIFSYFDKNNETYIQLNDTAICDTGTCGVKDYEFTTLAGADLYGHLIPSHSAESTEENYDNRSLNLDLTLNSENVVNVLKNYDLIINLIQNNEVIDTQTILNADLANNQKLSFDITNYETIFGTGYYEVELIAKTNIRQGDEVVESNVDVWRDFINLKELAAPTIAVVKSAKTEGEDPNLVYSLEYDVAISDPDKAISSGYYTVRLLDRDKNDISSKVKVDEEGNPVLDDDGNPILEPITIPVENLKTLRFVSAKVNDEDEGIVIPQIGADKPYQLVIEFNTHRNNQSLIDKNENIDKLNTYSYYTYSSGVSGVSLGDVEYKSSTEKSVTLAFYRSANLNNITKMDYTIKKLGQTETLSTKVYTVGEGMDKQFTRVQSADTDEFWTFTMEDENLKLEPNVQYQITYNFYTIGKDGQEKTVSTSNNSKTFAR